jgi:hypothetical protein
VSAWETLGDWSLDAVNRLSPVVVAVCPSLPRAEAGQLLHELAHELLEEGRLDLFAVCRGCRPKGWKDE